VAAGRLRPAHLFKGALLTGMTGLPPRRRFARGRGHLPSQLTFPSENHHRAGHMGRLRTASLPDIDRYRTGFGLRAVLVVPSPAIGRCRSARERGHFVSGGPKRCDTRFVLGQVSSAVRGGSHRSAHGWRRCTFRRRSARTRPPDGATPGVSGCPAPRFRHRLPTSVLRPANARIRGLPQG
jgi:hypothetical protein